MPSSGSEQGGHAILPGQCGVVRTGQLEAVLVHDRNVGIEACAAQANSLDLGDDAVTLFGRDAIEIDVFALHHSVDRRIDCNGLRLDKLVVGFDFLDFGPRRRR